MPTCILAKWQILLTEFDIVYVTRTAMKAQTLANHLAENPVDDEYGYLNTYFPDEEVNLVEEVVQDDNQIWKLYFDGAILVSPTGQHYPVTVHSQFHNKLVDVLATLASMLPYSGNTHIEPLEIQLRDQHGYCNTIEVEPDGEPWYRDIKQFLKTREYPKHANMDQNITIRRLSNGFLLSGEILYKRTPNLNLLRCVDAKEAEMIMKEVHSRVCGLHMNGYVLAKKILLAGYYWLTMERDCFRFVRKCHQCQIHSDLIHSPPLELYPMSAPSPFVAWGMDIIGPIETKASNGHKFILVTIDYFTKWVEAITLKAVTTKAIEVYEQFKIEHRNSTPNRPKANGATNKNIKKILRKMVQGYGKMVRETAFCLVGATPYLLVYGTEAVIPVEVEIPSL
ncbi:uncharacterized protein [Nicotiana tomentosiformis]|uniref:uncharacterized protein n=1 Tax=Nicotiana tomentosiformis TaxID=4098 RepID=UPI00388C75A5